MMNPDFYCRQSPFKNFFLKKILKSIDKSDLKWYNKNVGKYENPMNKEEVKING